MGRPIEQNKWFAYTDKLIYESYCLLLYLQQYLTFYFIVKPYFWIMKVDIELIDNLASLSKLNFRPEQKEEIRRDLEQMLNFMEQLNAVDTEGVEPLIYINEDVNVWRNDEVKQVITKTEALSNAPLKNEDYFMVPKFVNKLQ